MRKGQTPASNSSVMPAKRKRRAKVLEASKLVLRDASGEPRIVLDGGDDHKAGASIVLFDSSGESRIALDGGGENGFANMLIKSPDWRGTMQVGTQPSGAVVMSFGNKDMDGMLTLSEQGITLRARDGKLGVVIGPIHGGEDIVTVYKHGKAVWKSPTKKKGAKRIRKARSKSKKA